MNYASLAITLVLHTHTHKLSQTSSVSTQSQIWRKSQTVTISFCLDAAIVPTRWKIAEISHFRIIIQNVLKVGTGTTRWPGQFLNIVGFNAQLLRSTLGPLETIKIALFGNHKTAFWGRKKLNNSPVERWNCSTQNTLHASECFKYILVHYVLKVFILLQFIKKFGILPALALSQTFIKVQAFSTFSTARTKCETRTIFPFTSDKRQTFLTLI